MQVNLHFGKKKSNIFFTERSKQTMIDFNCSQVCKSDKKVQQKLYFI